MTERWRRLLNMAAMKEFMVDRAEEELKFAADRMLGRLAKWLRIIGQDVIYGRHLSGRGLVRAATQERRVMLTRDRSIRRWNPDRCIFIQGRSFPGSVEAGGGSLSDWTPSPVS